MKKRKYSIGTKFTCDNRNLEIVQVEPDTYHGFLVYLAKGNGGHFRSWYTESEVECGSPTPAFSKSIKVRTGWALVHVPTGEVEAVEINLSRKQVRKIAMELGGRRVVKVEIRVVGHG